MKRTTINAKSLRQELGDVIRRVQQGERFTVLYRSRPVCDIVPIGAEPLQLLPLEEDPLFEADAVGRSADGRSAPDHDDLLYGVEQG
jgi:antitoxin (DNA-binding transcriptional repressor) of toxin-antitoxin stability system